jgi:protein-S-isoprenylcysteine O-methyltransferase Ste14
MSVSPKMAAVTTIGTVAYLALGVIGEGGFGAFFLHGALIAVVVATLAMSAVAPFTKGNLSSGEREDRANRWVIVAFGAIGLAVGYLPALTDRLDFLTLDGDALRWFGVTLFVVGGALRMAPVFVLGERFSGLVAIQPEHKLVTDGLYRFIRNPSYLGLLVSTLGWALAFRAGVGVALTALLLPPLIARMRAEEALLGERFGDAYEAYRARTWRLVPGLY